MTREDILEHLDYIRSAGRLEYNDYSELHNMVSELEQQSQEAVGNTDKLNGDLISRKVLLEKKWDVLFNGKYIQVVDVGDIENAPPISQPQDGDRAVSLNAVIDLLNMKLFGEDLFKALYELPSVSQAGHWKVTGGKYICSNCGTGYGMAQLPYSFKWCPNCSARMGVKARYGNV